MKKLLVLIVMLSFIPMHSQQNETTVIYLIRHAEKADQNYNTNLSEAGKIRAQSWATILKSVPFDGFYSTPYNRTQQTIQPTADANKKEISTYNPKDFSLDQVIEKHLGKNILVVGHSNTIPKLINQFLKEDYYVNIDESEFGNLYIITIQGKTVSHQLLQL
ncbi:phosphoglycerate mutase family protein [Flavobacterium sp. '19STA2R22 D10 B1']|uniref:phosphoglycerate mutase family protein n=1 Tax=Flavobacterium aerium TaxID=3037261 RepID=UPI00278C2A5F|nr:phosphoglycerate mutase family protein [Flavobacterium sp. '19STA2R22 D10 B1']